MDEAQICRNLVAIMDVAYNMMDSAKEFTRNLISCEIVEILLNTMIWPSTDGNKLDVS